MGSTPRLKVTKLLSHNADTDDMGEVSYEPRTVMWARAEVYWQDEAGSPCVSAAVIEDTSASGACIRLRTPVRIGSQINVKWHRGEFSAVARNCRRDGVDFLLGVRREPHVNEAPRPETRPTEAPAVTAPVAAVNAEPAPTRAVQGNSRQMTPSTVAPTPARTAPPVSSSQRAQALPSKPGPAPQFVSHQERHRMESKSMFPKLWRREQADLASAKPAADALTAKASPPDPPEPARAKGDLLSYEDIYRAAGILRPRSAYEVHKVVEMLHSERIGSMPEEMRRASVLMAIEAAGASPDDLLRDATERQQALETYEAAQRKQLEQFEARKAMENAQLEAELARVAAHYAERIKVNLDQVTAEKDALRNWEMAKQHESQRIGEVIALCAPAQESKAALEASAGTRNGAAPRPNSGPSLVSGAATGRSN